MVFAVTISAQPVSENLVIVTLDGMRWQEVFGGADDSLISNPLFVRDTGALRQQFGGSDRDVRRKRLFPFLWSAVSSQGRLYGNRWLGNKVNNANRYWFSYPGYNEIFTGYPDDSVNSNDKIWNPNENVLEAINRQPGFRGKVAAFATWDVFPYILNTQRSGILVNADTDRLSFPQPGFKLINDLQSLTPRPLGVRPDVVTYLAAREYLKAYQPRVLYIAFDETDDYAHGGMYDQYLGAAHAEDGMLADLWKTLQGMPAYQGKTTLLVTCDHGRGDQRKEDWRHHGDRIPGAGEIWFGVMGPGIQPAGEVREPLQLYQRQLAATMARILGISFRPDHPVGEVIAGIFSNTEAETKTVSQ